MVPEPYQAEVVADSISPYGVRLSTLVVTFPRFVLAEFNTHRVFSRNSASSRAIPVQKRIEAVHKNPYVPLNFAKNKRGMQAGAELDEDEAEAARAVWLEARDAAIDSAMKIMELGVHKQWANRILEPFAWHTVLVTSTEWGNYFALRCNEMAQPEIRMASESMREALDASEPETKEPGEWHLPLVREEDYAQYDLEHLVKLSCARCARVSYLTHGGVRDPEKDLQLYERLASAGHMSPLEHAARVGDPSDDRFDWPPGVGGGGPCFIGNFRAPWIQHRKDIPFEDNFARVGR